MTGELSNSHMFYAYHIRSTFLACESALRNILDDQGMSPEHFYVLRSDWKPVETALEDIRVHAMLTKEEVLHAIDDLMARDYVVRGRNEDYYSLSAQGITARNQLLEAYHAHICEATEGLSKNTIEAALSSLLTIQNNINKQSS